MRKSIFIMAALAAASGGAMAKWVVIDNNDSSTIYANPSTIHKSANIVRISHLVSLSEPQTVDGTNKQFLSFKLQNEYDCKKSLVRALRVSFYDEAMGLGKIVYKSSSKDNWNPVDPKGGIATMWKFACAKR